MNTTKNGKRYVVILLALTYFASYITRYNFSSSISAIISAEGVTKAFLSPAISCAFITYGVGQIISGFFGDKFKPWILITSGLIVSAVMNFLLPFSVNQISYIIIWGINGFAQSFLWPPIVRILNEVFEGGDYKRATISVTCGGYIGNMMNYVISSIILTYLPWKYIFYFSSAVGLFFAAMWFFTHNKISSVQKIEEQTANTEIIEKKSFSYYLILIPILIVIALQGVLKDGVNTWIPAYMEESFGFGEAFAIGICFFLPVAGIIFVNGSSILYPRRLKTPIANAIVYFVLGGLSALGLLLIGGNQYILDLVLFFIILGAAHAVNHMFISITPKYFKNTGKIALISGILNSFTYVGSALSTYGLAKITDNLGWNMTFVVYISVAVLGIAICFAVLPFWIKKFESKKQLS